MVLVQGQIHLTQMMRRETSRVVSRHSKHRIKLLLQVRVQQHAFPRWPAFKLLVLPVAPQLCRFRLRSHSHSRLQVSAKLACRYHPPPSPGPLVQILLNLRGPTTARLDRLHHHHQSPTPERHPPIIKVEETSPLLLFHPRCEELVVPRPRLRNQQPRGFQVGRVV